MNIVKTKDEIRENLAQFENYLCGDSTEEQKFAYNLVENGLCFIAYKIDGELNFRFAPSRYIGYSNNSKSQHNDNKSKDGRETNVAITKIIGCEPLSDKELESEYLSFISKLGIKKRNGERKYWNLRK